jgi:mannan endo-1,4-beta-mannosidase
MGQRSKSALPRSAAVVLAALLLAGGAGGPPEPREPLPVDRRATPETRALFVNLRRLAGKAVLFGHQDDLAYGVQWFGEPGRSDVKETAGSYPAVYGWDAGGLEAEQGVNLDAVAFARQRGWIAEGYRRGGVITLSWHMRNPVSGGNAWDTTAAVAAILPGGAQHERYEQWLDRFAAYVTSLRAPGRDGAEVLVPVIFRPFHETSGGWFWWGARHATADEYRQLWRFTVEYLRDRRGVHNLLWAYSTDVFDSREAYLARYPGDAYVDVLGFDDYQSVRAHETRDLFARRLRDVVELAETRGKIPALTETGVEGVPDSLWWTGTLLAGLKSDSVTRRIAWVLVWRNATFEREHRHHFFAPYPGQASAADFVRFSHDSLVLLESELPDLYHLERR